jgi:hypothetical protein
MTAALACASRVNARVAYTDSNCAIQMCFALPLCSQVEPFIVGEALDARVSAITSKRSGPRKGQLEAIEQAKVQFGMVRTSDSDSFQMVQDKAFQLHSARV